MRANREIFKSMKKENEKLNKDNKDLNNAYEKMKEEKRLLISQLKRYNLELIKKYCSKYKRKRIRNKKIKEAELKALEELVTGLKK